MSENQSRNFVRMFQSQFVEAVEQGVKLRTIRKVPKRIPRAGDTISLRCWTGKPYRSKQRMIGTAVIARVDVVRIMEHGVYLRTKMGGCLHEEYFFASDGRADEFAKADGFSGWEEMKVWFATRHGLPFDGILMCWKKPLITAD